MTRSLEEAIINQCAPTLAGGKPASLFSFGGGQGQSPEVIRRQAEYWDRALGRLGLRVRVLRECPRTGGCLLLVYRPDWLEQLLAQAQIRAFFVARGYELSAGAEGVLAQLADRLCAGGEYPHEIGVLLGYPLEDVTGFMEHGGRDCVLCGCWKCYGDPEAARRRFAWYRACTAAYRRRWRAGTPVLDLVKAA